VNRTEFRGPVVVIGGGILGCSAAWHLLRAGVDDVTIVEAGTIGFGTSPAGAGFVALWAAGFFPDFGSPELEMEYYGLAFYRDLHEAGEDIGYRNNGNLFLALSEDDLARARGQVQHPDAPSGSRELTGPEVEGLTGVVRGDQVLGATWQPTGIQIEADAAVQSMARAVRAMGGQIVENAPVTDIVVHGSDVNRVVTAEAVLTARAIVVAGGAWTNELLAHLEFRLPLSRVVATRLISGPLEVPETMPTLQGAPVGWLRECRGGFTWAARYETVAELEAAGHRISKGRPRIHELLGERPEQANLWQVVRGAADGKPAVVDWLQGIICYTPDHRLYIGRVPSTPSVIVIGGDNETGVTHAPGMGRLAADLVLEREPFVDIRPFALDRLDSGQYPDEASVFESFRRTLGPDRPGPLGRPERSPTR
jgi:glycine/D-amino acid oxidase-like deaminating enzyme